MRSSVRRHIHGNAETGNPLRDQGLGAGRGGCVMEEIHFWPAGEMIYHCEEVCEPIGWWQGSHGIHVIVAKTAMGDTELFKRSCDVPLNLGCLARDAFFGPVPYLLL